MKCFYRNIVIAVVVIANTICLSTVAKAEKTKFEELYIFDEEGNIVIDQNEKIITRGEAIEFIFDEFIKIKKLNPENIPDTSPYKDAKSSKIRRAFNSGLLGEDYDKYIYPNRELKKDYMTELFFNLSKRLSDDTSTVLIKDFKDLEGRSLDLKETAHFLTEAGIVEGFAWDRYYPYSSNSILNFKKYLERYKLYFGYQESALISGGLLDMSRHFPEEEKEKEDEREVANEPSTPRGIENLLLDTTILADSTERVVEKVDTSTKKEYSANSKYEKFGFTLLTDRFSRTGDYKTDVWINLNEENYKNKGTFINFRLMGFTEMREPLIKDLIFMLSSNSELVTKQKVDEILELEKEMFNDAQSTWNMKRNRVKIELNSEYELEFVPGNDLSINVIKK